MRTRGFPRSQKIGAAILTLATLTLSIPLDPVNHMPDLPTLVSLLTLLVGAPLALTWSLWLTFRSPPSAVSQQ